MRSRESGGKAHKTGDYLLTAEIIIIGLAEAAHLAGVYFGWSFSKCAAFLGIMAGVALIAGGAFFLLCRSRQKPVSPKSGEEKKTADRAVLILYGVFGMAALSQLIFICAGDTVYRDRDMTAEIVESFLTTDKIYSVNPMTGLPFQGGMPSRLKILCLPTLYGSICKAAGLRPDIVVRVLVPAATLLLGYWAFSLLGSCLFPRNGKGQACFLLAVSLLIWAGAYRYGMDGFQVLYCGWSGVTIRNFILVPWLFSLCLRKKWAAAFLCVAAEACIVWTFYGFGVCAAVTGGMAAAGLCRRLYSGRAV